MNGDCLILDDNSANSGSNSVFSFFPNELPVGSPGSNGVVGNGTDTLRGCLARATNPTPQRRTGQDYSEGVMLAEILVLQEPKIGVR